MPYDSRSRLTMRRQIIANPNMTLGLLKIPVSDVEKSAAFYEEVLGFKKEFVAAEYGWAQFSADDLSLALYVPGMGGGDGKIGGSLDFHLCVVEYGDLLKRLQESKSLVEDMVHSGEDGSRYLEVIDPDGNTMKIMIVGE